MAEIRKNFRFSDIGRVEAFEICELPGILEDISLDGCKVHFPVPVTVDKSQEYELKVYPSRTSANIHDFVLVCQPRWVSSDVDGNDNEDSSIGFSILHSPGTQQLISYIEYLESTEISDKSESSVKMSDETHSSGNQNNSVNDVSDVNDVNDTNDIEVDDIMKEIIPDQCKFI